MYHNLPHHARRSYDCPITHANIEAIFTDCEDFESRSIAIGGRQDLSAILYYIDGVVNSTDVSSQVIRPITDCFRTQKARGYADCLRIISDGAVYRASLRVRESMDELVSDLCMGSVCIVFETLHKAICFETRSAFFRSVSKPEIEKSVKGSKDSFIESIRVNTTLVRRKIANPTLKIRQTFVGRKSRTAVAILYVEGIANPDYYTELRRRIDDIDIDSLISSASLSEYIIDCPSSPFPQLIQTERPDKFALNLLEGRVGILIDGLPMGYLLPATLSQFIKVPEDNAYHYVTASFMTFLRYLGLIITIYLPSLYIAVALYHQEMLPTKLLSSIIGSKQDVPFSTFFEILAMLIAFELLQEAGLRLPDPVGQTVSIIGALIVGQSAVEARVVSPIAVIVVALAGIAGYTSPSIDLGAALRLVRIAFAFAAFLGGAFGIMFASALLIFHLASIESFGVSYLGPIADGQRRSILRTILRPPLKTVKRRDPALHVQDSRTQK